MAEQPFDVPQVGEIIADGISFKQFLERYEDQAVEWHTGKVVAKMTNNNEVHHAILGFLHLLLSAYLGLKDTGKVYVDGYQMYVGDNQPARQPDLLVVLAANYDRIEHRHLNGPADLVVEIVSPSTGQTDRGAKFDEYEAAGVREYWIIDPTRQQIDIYYLTDEKLFKRIPDTSQFLTSKLLPQLNLSVSILWRDELPSFFEVAQLVQTMVSDDE